ncbi:hypothetical protein RDV78_10415 [Bacillota bacterium LX-D]|nr:hypothetical protein [Bacillota bacterium LX-D]
MKKISFSYYLFLLLLAPLLPSFLSIINQIKINSSLPEIGDKLPLLILAGIMTFLLTKLKGLSWELNLSLLWAILIQRSSIFSSLLFTTIVQNLESGSNIVAIKYFEPFLLAAAFYLILAVLSIKITRLKGKSLLYFLIWSLLAYQLGVRFINYKL